MPNNCYFEMKIAGPQKNVEEFIQMLQWAGPFQNNGLGRIFSFDLSVPIQIDKDPKTGNIAMYGQGDCANSLRTALLDSPSQHTFLDETARLGLAVEAYSSEPGCCFQEHFIARNGKMLVHDTVHYEEYSIEGADEGYIARVMEETGFSKEYLFSHMNCNGDFCIGGFDTFGKYKNLFSYFEKEPLSSRLCSAEQSRQPVSPKDKNATPRSAPNVFLDR